MTCERTFYMKTVDVREENGVWSIHIITQDDLKFEFKGGEKQAALLASYMNSEVKEP